MELDKKKVAIIGSGPAGLICATQLKSANFEVSVFDELKEFGGMIAYGIPEFRIPLETIRARIEDAKKRGIVFERKRIDSVKELLKSNNGEFDIVILAIGAGEGTKAGFSNEDSPFVIDALEFLLNDKLNNIKMVQEGELVGVIGGGNSAIDAARVAKKQGANVKIIYRRTENEMPALKNEVLAAKNELVEFEFLLAPKELILSNNDNEKNKLICTKMVLGEIDTSGRRKPIESNETKEFFFDKIITAIGQKNNFDWLTREGIKSDGKVILVNENYLTSIERVYAAGDCVTGAKTIGEATLSGINCAKSIILKYN